MLNHLFNKLNQYREQHLLRERSMIQSRQQVKLTANNQSYINFSSNDYYCLASHPEVIQAFVDSANRYGVGSGSSAIISGHYAPHRELEENFATLLNRDKALFFNSGYHANLAVLTVLAQRNSTVIADKLCHASIIDGIQLSRAHHYRFNHLDLAEAKRLLKQHNHAILVSESVFSMEGDIASVSALAKLATHYGATLVIDDAHGFGILGEHGHGISEYAALDQSALPCLITPLGKALGCMGAIVSGNNTFIESLIQFAKTYRYTTATPPAIASAAITALKILSQDNWHRQQLISRINYFNKLASEFKLPLLHNNLTPIKSIMLYDNELLMRLHHELMLAGYYVAAIRPPTVPKQSARLRISLATGHRDEDILCLLSFIKKFLIKHAPQHA